MTTTRHGAGKQMAQKETKEKIESQHTNPDANTTTTANEMGMADILRELRELRKENQTSFTETKASLARVEDTVKDVKERLDKLEHSIEEAEGRISATEDVNQRNERALRYLLRREAALANQCDDLQNRLRRNNLRVYQIPEGSEKEDMIGFVKRLITTVLNFPHEDIHIERAHRALGVRPPDTGPPRSIIIRFMDYTVKEAVLRHAWAQKQVIFQGKNIYFDQDYSPEVQRKRARIRGVIKQLKEKGVQARCRYPAQLRINLESGIKTFPTLIEAIPTLQEIGIAIKISEREKIERELSRESWNRWENGRRGENGTLSDADL